MTNEQTERMIKALETIAEQMTKLNEPGEALGAIFDELRRMNDRAEAEEERQEILASRRQENENRFNTFQAIEELTILEQKKQIHELQTENSKLKQQGFRCVVCGITPVDPENGYDTCDACAKSI